MIAFYFELLSLKSPIETVILNCLFVIISPFRNKCGAALGLS